MVGGLLQLVAYGAQDIYLTDDPQITFFKVVYRRHTVFSIQPFEKTFNEQPTFGKTAKVQLFRLGDLATKMYLRVVIGELSGTGNFAWVRRLGHALLSEVRIEVGGNMLDKQTNVWLDVWYELSRFGQRDIGYRKMIGDVDSMTEYNNNVKPEYTLYIPLQFWFNRHYGLALPMIAIHYFDVYIRVTIEDKQKLLVRSPLFTEFDNMMILDFGLVTDYVYLDVEERKKFATMGHEFLIEQVQFTGSFDVQNTINKVYMDFTRPTKEILWLIKNSKYNNGTEYICYSNKDDWTPEIVRCSTDILRDSILLLIGNEYIIDSSGNKVLVKEGEKVTLPGNWIMFDSNSIAFTPNHSLRVINNSMTMALWLNIDSLVVGNYSLTASITGTISVDVNNKIAILVVQGLSDMDVSIPLNKMTDTRINGPHIGIFVYQFSNYGVYITGKKNPVTNTLLEYNGDRRFEKRDGTFFGVLHPYLHHSSTPADGINLYSFAFDPEKQQPSGVSNFSAIETIVLTVWVDENILLENNPELFIFGYSYNIFKISNGIVALMYY